MVCLAQWLTSGDGDKKNLNQDTRFWLETEMLRPDMAECMFMQRSNLS